MARQIRDSVDQDELDFDTKQGRFAPYQESFEDSFSEVFKPSEKKSGKWVGDNNGFQVLVEDKPVKSIFIDEVKDLPIELPKSKIVKLRYGKEVVIDLKDRSKKK